ncbi:sulfite exporter TauE/SafE family protein [Cryobacterium melibiosiphilum]|uniref:Probable membrane transporter protein n=1 Tax=Cryobacterium melibiosiphilum TaxID=995039 RepID=A0A3A5MRR9_9MICO|nr:sulfite exporter TauE/SafE family protein [Cryobacterium melibiosiphilum]RJT90519.1 sulfite exporter TauE/SafE family protein [Cryobacterium melibiosiphilum]
MLRHGARYWIILLAVGLIGGLLSGTFGVGGGIIMVPLLVSLAGMDQRRAAATTLVAIVPAATVGAITYLANGETDLVAGGFVAFGAIFGAVLGSWLLKRLPLVWLRWMFIALLVGVAVRMLLVVPVRGEQLDLTWYVVVGYIVLGLIMGIASGLFGIGGGVIAVPALIAVFGISDLIAKGTSLLVMIPTGIVGTISNVRGKLVDVRAGLVVGAAATAASAPGVAIALILPPQVSSILFAALLVLAAVQLTIKAIRAQRKPKPEPDLSTPDAPRE